MKCLAARCRQVCVAEAEHPDGSQPGLRISPSATLRSQGSGGGACFPRAHASLGLLCVPCSDCYVFVFAGKRCFVFVFVFGFVFGFWFLKWTPCSGPSGSRLLRLSQLTARSLPVSNDLEPYCRATVGNDTQQTIAQGSGTVAPSWSQRLTFKGASPLPGASVCIGTRTIMTGGRANGCNACETQPPACPQACRQVSRRCSSSCSTRTPSVPTICSADFRCSCATPWKRKSGATTACGCAPRHEDDNVIVIRD